MEKILKQTNVFMDKILENFCSSELGRACAKALILPIPFALMATLVPFSSISMLLSTGGGLFSAAVVIYSICGDS